MLHWLFKFSQKFNKAAEVIRNFSSGPTEDEFKEVYAVQTVYCWWRQHS